MSKNLDRRLSALEHESNPPSQIDIVRVIMTMRMESERLQKLPVFEQSRELIHIETEPPSPDLTQTRDHLSAARQLARHFFLRDLNEYLLAAKEQGDKED